jgi:hypothetical protein
VAVFVLRGDRLQQWLAARWSGDFERVEVSINEAGVLADVVRTGRPDVRAASGPSPAGLAALSDARAAAAFPITVGGAVVAVLYADSPVREAVDDARWSAGYEVLARHASRVLEAITIQRAAGLLPAAGAAPPVAAGHSGGNVR